MLLSDGLLNASETPRLAATASICIGVGDAGDGKPELPTPKDISIG